MTPLRFALDWPLNTVHDLAFLRSLDKFTNLRPLDSICTAYPIRLNQRCNIFIMASTRLTPAERSCCTFLSELFLDIRVSPHDHFLIARALRRLDLPIDTIEHMLRYEIFPVLWTNLLNIAGEWGGWDEDWLAGEVEKWRQNPGNLLYRGWLWLWWRYHEDYMMEHWNEIKKW